MSSHRNASLLVLALTRAEFWNVSLWEAGELSKTDEGQSHYSPLAAFFQSGKRSPEKVERAAISYDAWPKKMG
jgi:hypothetical protein